MPDVDRLLSAIDAEEEDAYGSDGDSELSAERATAIDLYLGKNLIPVPEGRSNAQDRSVYEVVSWVMPSLTRIFANGDDVVELPPVGPEDEAGAKQEAQFLNHILLQKNNWFEIFDTASKDALLTKAGYIHAYAEDYRQVELEKYERQTPESLGLIMQDAPQVVSRKEYPDPDYVEPPPQPMMQPGPDGQPMPVVDQQTGQPVMQPPQGPPMLYDVQIRRTKVEKKFCVEVFPPERCKISKSTKTVQLRECPYFEYYDFPTLSDLRQLGYEVPDDTGTENDSDTMEDTARDQYMESVSDHNALDPAMKRVKCRWIWIRHDYDEDGIAEMQYIVRVGRKVLYREEVTRIPVAVLCPDKLPHRHIGMCPADTVAEIQQIKTAILRQGLDNLYLSNNSQKYADGKFVNLDDMLISRPGSTIRLKAGAVFGQNFGVMQVPFIFPQAIEGLGYMDHVKETRTGVNNSFQGLDAGQLTQLQPGTVNQISSMAAQRVEQIARHFSNGITELMAILHEVVLKSGHKKEVVQLRGQWVEVDPTTWRKRTDFRISVGFAAGNKDAQITRLMMIGNMQKEAMLGGLPIVTPENIYETMNELIKASDLQAPQRFLTHPSKAPQKPPPEPDVTVMAMEKIKSETTLKVKDAELKTEKEVTAATLVGERENAELEAQTKLTIAQMQANHAHDLERVRGEQSNNLEHTRAQLNPKTKEADAKVSEVKQKDTLIQQMLESQERQTQAIGAMFQQMLDSMSRMNGPKQIVRGRDGRASHVVPVDANGQNGQAPQ